MITGKCLISIMRRIQDMTCVAQQQCGFKGAVHQWCGFNGVADQWNGFNGVVTRINGVISMVVVSTVL